jgi:hypothetical protein
MLFSKAISSGWSFIAYHRARQLEICVVESAFIP